MDLSLISLHFVTQGNIKKYLIADVFTRKGFNVSCAVDISIRFQINHQLEQSLSDLHIRYNVILVFPINNVQHKIMDSCIS